jgi:hypothetical protein
MPTPVENFISLSVQLCGITRFDLFGTGYANRYFDTVKSIVGEDRMTRLIDTFAALPSVPAALHAALPGAILNHPEFGAIARNIIKLWYTATWFQLSSVWRDQYGKHEKDVDFVPYAYGYPESFLGPAVGAHPPGAKPTGHQSWSLPPQKILDIPAECV